MGYSATDVVLIIGAISLAVTSIISTWRTSAKLDANRLINDKNQEANVKKLEEIHSSTNGNLSELKVKIDALEKKSILDTASVISLQDIVRNLSLPTTATNVVELEKPKKP